MVTGTGFEPATSGLWVPDISIYNLRCFLVSACGVRLSRLWLLIISGNLTRLFTVLVPSQSPSVRLVIQQLWKQLAAHPVKQRWSSFKGAAGRMRKKPFGNAFERSSLIFRLNPECGSSTKNTVRMIPGSDCFREFFMSESWEIGFWRFLFCSISTATNWSKNQEKRKLRGSWGQIDVWG